MSEQKLSTQIRKQQIARAVLDLIAANGMRDLSMAAVARHTGLVPSAIYRHFRNKEEMLETVLDFVRTSLMENIELARASTPDPLGRLHYILLHHMDLVRQNKALPQIVFSTSAYSDDSRRKKIIRDIIQAYLSLVAKIFAEGQQTGLVRDDTDATVLSVMFLGLVQPPILLHHLTDGEFDVENQVAMAWTAFQRAIRPVKPNRNLIQRNRASKLIEKEKVS